MVEQIKFDILSCCHVSETKNWIQTTSHFTWTRNWNKIFQTNTFFSREWNYIVQNRSLCNMEVPSLFCFLTALTYWHIKTKRKRGSKKLLSFFYFSQQVLCLQSIKLFYSNVNRVIAICLMIKKLLCFPASDEWVLQKLLTNLFFTEYLFCARLFWVKKD